MSYLNKTELIVGVVADTVQSSAARLNAGAAPLTSEEAIYLPAAQIVDAQYLALVHTWFQPSWIVRTAGPFDGVTGQMQRLPIPSFRSPVSTRCTIIWARHSRRSGSPSRCWLALLLTAVGIFAVVANTSRTGRGRSS